MVDEVALGGDDRVDRLVRVVRLRHTGKALLGGKGSGGGGGRLGLWPFLDGARLLEAIFKSGLLRKTLLHRTGPLF